MEFKQTEKTAQDDTVMDNNGGPVLRESNVGMLNPNQRQDEEKGTFAEGPACQDNKV